jgi:hypothetical protein
MNWNTTEPPKDQTFIANVGLPYAVIAVWNGEEQHYAYADLQVNLCKGEWNDTYFENDYVDTINGWMPLPEVE